MVCDYMHRIPKGATRSIAEMREDFAKANKSKGTCPMTSSIFARIVAEAALEDLAAGRAVDQVAPFWRLIDETSPIAKKLSCGAPFINRMRREETSERTRSRKGKGR